MADRPSRRAANWPRTGRSGRRVAAQLTAVLVLGGLLVVVPRPAVAVEREMVHEAVTPELEPRAPLAPAGQQAGASGPGATAASTGDTGEVLAATDSAVDEFALIGVSFDSEADRHARVRVHQPDGPWSEWVELEVDPEEAPDPGSAEGDGRLSSSPLWVGSADGYEVELPVDARSVEVHLVREGGRQIRVTGEEDEAHASHPGAPQPTIYRRSQWGATPARGAPVYSSSLTRAVIHHTVNSNGYAAGDVPAMLRSIQAYHMGSRGWEDIGYNFVIDRFGRTWEGRAGGIDRAVVAAVARSYNVNSTSVSFLGDFTQTAPTQASLDAAVRLLAWKLQVHQNQTANVVGHRDLAATACPGGHVYARLGSIRSATQARMNAFPPPAHSDGAAVGDFDADGRTDAVVHGAGSLPDWVLYGNPDGGFDAVAQPLAGSYRLVVGDFDGDGDDDVFLYAAGTAADYLWRAEGRTLVPESLNVNGTYRPVVGDLDADGHDDVVWHAPGPTQDHIWWGGETAFTGEAIAINGQYAPFRGDFDGDGIDDVFWYQAGSGADYVWWGGAGGYTVAAFGVNGIYSPAVGDFDGDHGDDVLWYGVGTRPDALWYSRGDRTGFLGHGTRVDGAYRVSTGDYDGDARDDVMWHAPGSARDFTWFGEVGSFVGVARTVNGTYEPHSGQIDGAAGEDVFWYGRVSHPDANWLGQADRTFTPVGLPQY